MPSPELVSLSGDLGNDELLALPDMRPALCGLPGPKPDPGGGVLTPLPFK